MLLPPAVSSFWWLWAAVSCCPLHSKDLGDSLKNCSFFESLPQESVGLCHGLLWFWFIFYSLHSFRIPLLRNYPVPGPTHGQQTQKQISHSTCCQRAGSYRFINDVYFLRVPTRKLLSYSAGHVLVGEEAWYTRLGEKTKKLSHIDLDFFPQDLQ